MNTYRLHANTQPTPEFEKDFWIDSHYIPDKILTVNNWRQAVDIFLNYINETYITLDRDTINNPEIITKDDETTVDYIYVEGMTEIWNRHDNVKGERCEIEIFIAIQQVSDVKI